MNVKEYDIIWQDFVGNYIWVKVDFLRDAGSAVM